MTATNALLAPVRISPVRFRSITSKAQAPGPASPTAQAHRDAHFARTHYGQALSPKPSPDAPVLRMLMFGKPGAGKGTLSTRLVNKYDINFLSAGDILRQNIADKTEVGRIAEEIVAAGGLLPDDVITNVVTSKLDAPALQHRPWILDGFPRTVGQGELLDVHLRNKSTPLSLIVNVDVSDEIILGRISDRWIHSPSGRVYNMSYNRPKVDGRDDVTGEPLVKRPDDNPEIFARRLKAFYEQTSPLLAYYASRASASTRLVTLKGATSDEIWPQLEGIVQQSFRLRPKDSSSHSPRVDLASPRREEGKRVAEMPA
ncbi:adenylate kinase [Exidia glandulosa HHB12029]|uniref:Adenylate kinase n=1 Tax=Exidia glandulosa HHB12029 TaxID=1314781 RepID=A0A165DFI3_EXIGL|nr:adenylate kinase [Exidia glandulosa HHB12029]